MRSFPDPGFAGDAGDADPAVTGALAVYARDGSGAPVLAALSRSRVLVPVVALETELETEVERNESGLAHDKRTDIAAVLMLGRDGRTALLAFTSLESLRAWDPAARPVPVSCQDAARSAIQEGASALLVDVAGPVMCVVETPDLEQLAAGKVLTPTAVGDAWVQLGKATNGPPPPGDDVTRTERAGKIAH
ncbi:MAG: SseB family protein [Nocardioidaceae bacterium]|nr:SseB family protein [Nocardioidaceae bacterium]